MADMCPACRVGMVFECWSPNIETGMNCADMDPMEVLARQAGSVVEVPDTEKKLPGGQVKDDEDIKDVTSTGRKRAVALFPLEEGMICEWSGLLNAGGGVAPIVGCRGKPATARHHGPDKSTLNNEVGNVHRICVHCHNRWHTRNDDYYGERPPHGRPFIPLDMSKCKIHDPETKASEVEYTQSELYWLQNRPKRAED